MKPIKKHLTNALFVDPGLGGTGLAFFDIIRTKDEAPGQVLFTTVLESNAIRWQARAEAIAMEFSGLISSLHAETIVIESPELWSGSAVSQASVERGDLLKLMYLVGCLGMETKNLCNKSPILVKAAEWKGQLPKEVVIKRIKVIYPSLNPKNHEADAIGMGLSFQGKLCQ